MSATQPHAIFLDDGGVLNDNNVRAPQWQRLVGEYLAPRLGGAPEAWGEANRVVFDQQWRRFEQLRDDETLQPVDYAGFFETRVERERWLREMCEAVGVAAPSSDDCYRLAIETEDYVMPRVRSAYPDAVAAVHTLHDSGARLFTASSGSSGNLEYCLGGMGIRHLFGPRLYGPDLAGVPKPTPEFYQRIFADAGVEPSGALVVDDSERALDCAAAVGARTVLVWRNAETPPGPHEVIGALSELPRLLQSSIATSGT
jgi:HAD superfamily hydrolase (TIGR01509 family)